MHLFAGRTRLARILPALVVALAVAAATLQAQTAPTTVIIVRHAEKAATPANDPPLTPEGEARAQALAEMLRHANIGAVISTPFARTRSTVAPVATARGLTIETVPVAGAITAHAAAVAEAVRRHSGKTVLVAGHSNTVPAIAAALGAPRLPDICDEVFDEVFIVQLVPGSDPSFVRARYGEPSPRTSCAPMGARGSR